MKILWIINIVLPAIAKELNIKASNREGWLSGTFNSWKDSEEFQLAVACPKEDIEAVERLKINNIQCYLYRENLSSPEIYDKNLEIQLKEIINEYNPDLVHIFGSEFPHGLAAAKVFNHPDRILLGIQGVCYKIAEDYMAKLPDNIINKRSFRDIVRKDSLLQQQQKFQKRAQNEIELLKCVNNVTGRTKFDYEATKAINNSLTYYPMNETMRNCFYEKEWVCEKAERNSIFIGQGDYPIKGMHFLLEAAGTLIKKYSNLKIYIAGNSITDKAFYKLPMYGIYLKKLIKDNNLEGHIVSLGPLTEEEMRDQYLKCSVYVCSSYVENSPNTIAEAMLLGMPVVTTDAGGICSIISDEEGFICEKGNSLKLAKCIEAVWQMEEISDENLNIKCQNARRRALEDYSREKNHNRLLDIYRQIG